MGQEEENADTSIITVRDSHSCAVFIYLGPRDIGRCNMVNLSTEKRQKELSDIFGPSDDMVYTLRDNRHLSVQSHKCSSNHLY